MTISRTRKANVIKEARELNKIITVVSMDIKILDNLVKQHRTVSALAIMNELKLRFQQTISDEQYRSKRYYGIQKEK